MSIRFPDFERAKVEKRDVDLTLQQGRDRRLLVTVKDQSGSLVDITGASDILYEIAEEPGGSPLVSYSLSDANIAVTNDSEYRIDIGASDLSELHGIYYHDSKIITSGGKEYSTLLGPIWIQQTVVEVAP